MKNEIMLWHNKTIADKVINALKQNNFNAEFFKDSQDAVNRVLELIPKDSSIGFGGSETVKEIGLKEKVKERGNIIFDHSVAGLSPEESMKIRRSQLTSDFFICSSNAITLDGKLVNIDGAGNRVASMSFGPKNVIIIAGMNKIVSDVSDGIKRIQTKAAPMNCKRLSRETPCVKTGLCANCSSPGRICNITHILDKKPYSINYFVFLIDENLGY